jgi:hypothetical protein
MIARLLIVLTLGAIVFVPVGESKPLPAPTGMHGFLLRADESFQRTFSRTPSFAWEPYEGASSYDAQLAMSSKFDDRTLVWSTDGMAGGLRVPAVAIPVALPWMTGKPYALYVRVRAHVGGGVTRWSTPFGFNTSWHADDGVGGAPQQVLPDTPGLVRWTPIDGATSYQVWFTSLDPTVNQAPTGKATAPVENLVSTTTNVADEREFYSTAGGISSDLSWRVRAVREVYGPLPNGLPRTSYGPWSPPYLSFAQTPQSGIPTPNLTVSDITTANSGSNAQTLTPGYAFTGGGSGESPLFRVYVATDRHCVNIVYTGAAVASPAYAPRTKAQGPGAAAGTAVDGETVTPTEASGKVDLWDLGRPNARYWWTVVPVDKSLHDLELPQDACDTGRVMEFSKISAAVTASTTRPYVSGLSRFGGLVAAQTKRPSFFRAPLVAWEPARGATSYEVQWSQALNPWKTQKSLSTPGTSMLVQGLAPGIWYYRVRGIDDNALGFKEMTWSTPVSISISRPQFFNESNVTVRKVKK